MSALLALLSSLSWGVADFMGGVATRRVGPIRVLAVSYPSGAFLLTVLAIFIIPGNLSTELLPWALAAGILGAMGIGLLYLALSYGPMGIVSPIAALMSAAIPVLAGIFRGENLTLLAVVGMAVAIVAVIMVCQESGHHERMSVMALVLAVVSGVTLGSYLTVLGLSPADSGIWVTTIGRWISTLAMLLIFAAVIRNFSRQTFPWRLVVFAGLLDAIANGAFQLASQRGLLAVVAVIGSLYPAATVVLARGLLGERMNRIQITGVFLALGAAATLALTK